MFASANGKAMVEPLVNISRRCLFEDSLRRRILTDIRFQVIFAAGILAGGMGDAFGHGSVLDPVSRVYRIFQENPESPDREVSSDAIEMAGTQAFYDWHEVSRVVPDYDSESIAPYRAIIPDGQLAGAGREKYAGLNLERGDWPATSVNPGIYPVIFDAWVPHDPSYFLAFVTRDGWSPDQPLNWDDLEALPGAAQAVRDDHYYTFSVDLPQRTGHHVLYVIWQRIDPAGEAFFSASDIDFGDGTGNGNGGGGPAIRPVIPHEIRAEVDFAVQSDWGSGFTGEAKITNLANHPINSWELEFMLEEEISSFWNAELIQRAGNRYTVRNLDWNQSIAPGESVVFGFSASPGGLAQLRPSNLFLNGISLHVHTAPPGNSLRLEVMAGRVSAEGLAQLKLRFPAMVGRLYSVERSVDLVHWDTHESDIAGQGGVIERNYAMERGRMQFFRIRENHP